MTKNYVDFFALFERIEGTIDESTYNCVHKAVYQP